MVSSKTIENKLISQPVDSEKYKHRPAEKNYIALRFVKNLFYHETEIIC